MTISKAMSTGNKPNEVVSVLDYGATGNGTTDDSAAIQAALDSGKLNIYIPAGTYKINTALSFPDGVRFTGEHVNAVSFDCSGITGSYFKVNGTTSPDDSFEDIVLSNFEIDGGASTQTVGNHGIDVFKTTFVRLENLRVKDCGDNGLEFRGRNFHVTIKNVDLIGNYGYGSNVDWDSTSRNNAFYWESVRWLGGNANSLRLDQCNTHKFQNCYFEDIGSTGQHIFMADNVNKVEFDTCYFENNTLGGRHIEIDGSSSSCSGIAFKNCTLASAVTNALTLVYINNGQRVSFEECELSISYSSATSSFIGIEVTANAGLINERGIEQSLAGSSVVRSVNDVVKQNRNYWVNNELLLPKPLVNTHTSSTVITTEEGGNYFNNEGAASIITDTLPNVGATEKGITYTFTRTNGTYAYRIDPNGSDNIRGGGAGKYISLDSNGASITLVNLVGATWDIIASNGTTSFEP